MVGGLRPQPYDSLLTHLVPNHKPYDELPR